MGKSITRVFPEMNETVLVIFGMTSVKYDLCLVCDDYFEYSVEGPFIPDCERCKLYATRKETPWGVIYYYRWKKTDG